MSTVATPDAKFRRGIRKHLPIIFFSSDNRLIHAFPQWPFKIHFRIEKTSKQKSPPHPSPHTNLLVACASNDGEFTLLPSQILGANLQLQGPRGDKIRRKLKFGIFVRCFSHLVVCGTRRLDNTDGSRSFGAKAKIRRKLADKYLVEIPCSAFFFFFYIYTAAASSIDTNNLLPPVARQHASRLFVPAFLAGNSTAAAG